MTTGGRLADRARAPLFDRLVDEEPWRRRESPPRRTLDPGGLRESVRRELERLFNTRSPLPTDRLAAMTPAERTVIDYGVPDTAGFSAANRDHRLRLGDLLTRSVAAYEPRLGAVTVEVRQDPDDGEAVMIYIDALLQMGQGVTEPITFPVVLRDGRSRVHISEHV